MPELPEAETIARTLAPRVAGQRIVAADYPGRRVWRGAAAELAGKRIDAVSRYGKQILFAFDSGFLLVRLGMTGALLTDAERGDYTRAFFALSHGRLVFDDIRQFGWLEYLEREPDHLGPDPLLITGAEFAARLRGRRSEAKRVLLDQQFVRGVGNIYADEALFRAAIHPRAATARLARARAERLHAELAALLEESIACGGSSISDYVDATGARGTFQLRHRVYGKAGAPCPNCGRPIQKMVLAQRGTHYCGHCQRR